MSIEIRDGAGVQRYLEGVGAGSSGDPYVPRNDIMPALTVDRSLGAAASKVVKASAGTLFSYSCTNLNASIRYFQLFDSTSTPSGGATPLTSMPVYGNGGFLVIDALFLGTKGNAYSTGITWGFSTTALTYTAGTASDAIVVVRYL